MSRRPGKLTLDEVKTELENCNMHEDAITFSVLVDFLETSHAAFSGDKYAPGSAALIAFMVYEHEFILVTLATLYPGHFADNCPKACGEILVEVEKIGPCGKCMLPGHQEAKCWFKNMISERCRQHFTA